MMRQVKSKQRVADHGEVFTAEREVLAMLDLVKNETERVDSCFLEPACGEGNFLVEILRRKLKSAELQTGISNKSEYERMAMTSLASLYGIDILMDNVKNCRDRLLEVWVDEYRRIFSNDVREETKEHLRFILSRNIICGNSLSMKMADDNGMDADSPIVFNRWSDTITVSPRDMKLNPCTPYEMGFDVIIGNPPYQITVNESGKGLGAIPLYNKFVEQAISLSPRYLSMIIPSRWFSGGVGLESFRRNMLSDKRISRIYDFIDSGDCFPGVDINGGICYFLWERDYSGQCEYTNFCNGKESTALRDLGEYNIFIRRNEALSIVQKVLSRRERMLSDAGGCSPQTPYGFLSTYKGNDTRLSITDCELLSSKGWSFVEREKVSKYSHTIDMYKPMFSKLTSEHAGNPDKKGSYRVLSRMEVLRPGQICTQSYLIACPTFSQEEAVNTYNYLRTKFVRFLILQTLVGMNISINNFVFVPRPDFSKSWNDEELYAKYGLTKSEINLVETMIKPMDYKY